MVCLCKWNTRSYRCCRQVFSIFVLDLKTSTRDLTGTFESHSMSQDVSLRTVQLLGMRGVHNSLSALNGCVHRPSSTTEALDRLQYSNTLSIVNLDGRRLLEVWNASSSAAMNPNYMFSIYDVPQAHLYPKQQQHHYNTMFSSDLATYLRTQALE